MQTHPPLVEGQVCLHDHLLDKTVLDCDDDEVDVASSSLI
jgi:hypothetical protein